LREYVKVHREELDNYINARLKRRDA